MKRLSMKGQPARLLIPGGVFIGILILSALVWSIVRGTNAVLGVKLAYGGSTLMLAFSLSLLSWNWLSRRRVEQEPSLRDATNIAERESLQRRLDGMVQLNELLIDAQNEEELIKEALKIISGVVGSAGASFVPYDEWGQPLRAHIYGAYPAPVLRAWSEHLSSPVVRQRCQVCKDLKGDLENECPL
ncbi:MAG: hypothetical protein ACYCYC_09730, partial [Bellilinea sp.]